LNYFALFVAASAFASSADQPTVDGTETSSAPPAVEVAAPTDPDGGLPPEATDAEPPPPVAPPAERLEEGWERVLRGDYKGGEIMAEQVLQAEAPEHHEEALYLKAFSLEWGGAPEEALPLFDALIRRWPAGQYSHDSLFRKTETLGKLARYDEALDSLKQHFETDKALSQEDQLKVTLLKGIWMIEQGKAKPGARKVYKALLRDDTDDVSWYQGQANSALVSVLIAEIEEMPLSGSTKKMRKQLTTQAALMSTAEALLRRTVALSEPAWILDQLLRIGDGYQILGDHLRDAPVGSLDAIQLAAYKQELRAQIETVYIKALKHYELGLEHADRVQWSGKSVSALEEAREQLTAKIEAL
jgi:tetratricopeptide (TPR) repeat protein